MNKIIQNFTKSFDESSSLKIPPAMHQYVQIVCGAILTATYYNTQRLKARANEQGNTSSFNELTVGTSPLWMCPIVDCSWLAKPL